MARFERTRRSSRARERFRRASNSSERPKDAGSQKKNQWGFAAAYLAPTPQVQQFFGGGKSLILVLVARLERATY